MARTGLEKAAVVAAAAEIADRQGGDHLTLAVLAEKLGVRPPSLYSHVHGLEGLRRDLVVYYQRLLSDRLRWVAVGVAGRDAVVALAEAYVGFFLEHPGTFGLPVQRYRRDPEVEAAMDDSAVPLLVVLRSYGLGRRERAHWLRVIWTACYGFALVRSAGMMVIDANPDESFRLMISAFADALDARVRALVTGSEAG